MTGARLCREAVRAVSDFSDSAASGYCCVCVLYMCILRYIHAYIYMGILYVLNCMNYDVCVLIHESVHLYIVCVL